MVISCLNCNFLLPVTVGSLLALQCFQGVYAAFLPLLSFVSDERETNTLHSPQVVPRQVRADTRNYLSIKFAFPFCNQGPGSPAGESDVKKRNRLKVLKDIEPAMIAGQGVTAGTGTTLQDNNCAWALAKNVADAPSIAPVFVTRNVNVAQLVTVAGNDLSTDADALLNSQKPFQKDGCVIIYKDGSGKKFKGDDVYPAKLLEGLGTSKLNEFEQGDGNKFEFLSSGKSN